MSMFEPRGAAQKITALTSVQRIAINPANAHSYGNVFRIIVVGDGLVQVNWSSDSATLGSLAVNAATATPIRANSELYVILPAKTAVMAFVASASVDVYVQSGNVLN